jgi:hypothetical protein
MRVGHRLYRAAFAHVHREPQGHWKMATFVAGLRNNAVTAPFVIDEPMNGEIFLAYLE